VSKGHQLRGRLGGAGSGKDATPCVAAHVEATACVSKGGRPYSSPESYGIALGRSLGGKPTVSFYAHGIGGSGVARSVRTAIWNTRSVRTAIWNTRSVRTAIWNSLSLLPRGFGDGFTPRWFDEPRPQLHGSHDCLR